MKVTRNIIDIDEEKCDGCGLCVTACHEGAIALVDGKARLVKEQYCDGLGDCIGECPRGAITIEKRVAAVYDEEAVAEHIANKSESVPHTHSAGGCPGAAAMCLSPSAQQQGTAPVQLSSLANWPVQLHLVPPQAPYLKNSDLLICADCVPFALAGFHENLLAGRVALIGCPKLDDAEAYVEKLTQVFALNGIASVTIARMEVPCCGGLTNLVTAALIRSGQSVPARVVTVSIDGSVISDEILQ